MARDQYETDDETGIYLEDDPNYEEPIIEGSDRIIDNNNMIIPQEDPINDDDDHHHQDKTKKGSVNTSRILSDEVSMQSERMIKLSKVIKKWGICWLVLFIVAIAITGTVFMFRNYLLKSDSSEINTNASNSNNKDSSIDIRVSTPTPSSIPSVIPTFIPTVYPSVSPSVRVAVNDTNTIPVSVVVPTNAPTTETPTNVPTTMTPSSTPSTILYSQIISIIRSASTNPDQFNDRDSYESQAAHWVKNNSTIDLLNNEKIIQRYTIALLDLSLNTKFTIALPPIDECEWIGITCQNEDDTAATATDFGTVTNAFSYSPISSIIWNDLNMTGQQIPNDIGLLSNSLIQIDLSNNKLAGTLPSGLYACTALQYLYLYDNQLSGNIGSHIGQLSSLRKAFFSTNVFTGSIPSELSISSLGTILALFVVYQRFHILHPVQLSYTHFFLIIFLRLRYA
jgi:hypothetical protein